LTSPSTATKARVIENRIKQNVYVYDLWDSSGVIARNRYSGPDDSPFVAVDGDVNCLLIGDSKTYRDGWQTPFCTAMTPGTWVTTNHGISGITTVEMRAQIDTILAGISTNHEYVFLNLGTNDITDMPANGDVWKADYQYILDAVAAKMLTRRIYISKPGRRYSEANKALIAGWIDDLVTANPHCAHGDNEQIWVENGDDGITYTDDGIHYNAAGMAEKAAQLSTIVLAGL